MVLTTSVFVAATGAALAVTPASQDPNLSALPVFEGYNDSMLVRDGSSRTDLIDTDVNMGNIAWDFDSNFSFVAGAFIEGLPDLTPINGGPVSGGPSLDGGGVTNEFSYTKDGLIPGTGFQHTIVFSTEVTSDFIPAPFTFTSTGTTADFISIDMGTSNVGNPILHSNALLSIVSADLEIFVGGSSIGVSDMLTDPLSFFGTSNPGVSGDLVVQAFTPPLGSNDIAGFGINKLEATVTYITAPTPGAAALFGLAGLAGLRRRR